jgi:homoserine kinase type II
VLGVRELTEILERHWGMAGAEVCLLSGGMNSLTWRVEHEGATYVAKRVPPSDVSELVAGGVVAAALAEAGFVTGCPIPTKDGEVVAAEAAVALLEYVPGRELEGRTDEEQVWIASTLAGVHAASKPVLGPSMASFASDWLAPHSPGIQEVPWLASAIQTVRDETDPLTVTWSVLHTDPAPEAFIHDKSTGVTGLIDWAGARQGPVLYDVASAVMYLGGPASSARFLDCYQAFGVLLVHDEMEHLDAFLRFRYAVQGVYFAGRLATQNLTGGLDEAGNTQGLNDAHRGLRSLGLFSD